MTLQKVIVLGSNNVPAQYSPLQSSAGSGSAGALIALNAAGQVDETMLPEAIGATYTASESVATGAFVFTTNVAGTGEVCNANATDSTKPCVGWVPAAIGSSSSGQVNFAGINTAVPIGSFTASNIGEEVFLSTTNGVCCARSTAFTTGQLVQRLGKIIAVNTGASTMSVAFNPDIVCVA